jgi:hypothetical protein
LVLGLLAYRALGMVFKVGAVMDFEGSNPRCNGLGSGQSSPEGSVAWYMVVGIEFFLFAAIVAPVICGALLAR